MRIQIGKWLQHQSNELHVYCRLREIGFGKVWARKLALAIHFFFKIACV